MSGSVFVVVCTSVLSLVLVFAVLVLVVVFVVAVFVVGRRFAVVRAASRVPRGSCGLAGFPRPVRPSSSRGAADAVSESAATLVVVETAEATEAVTEWVA